MLNYVLSVYYELECRGLLCLALSCLPPNFAFDSPGRGPGGGQAHGPGHSQLPQQTQQAGQEPSLLDLDQPRQSGPALPDAPVTSEDEAAFNPVSSPTNGLHGVVGDHPTAGPMSLYLLIFPHIRNFLPNCS